MTKNENAARFAAQGIFADSEHVGCNSDTCYAVTVNLGDTGNAEIGYPEWARTASNTCRNGQTFGKALCGDLDRTFGTSATGRLR